MIKSKDIGDQEIEIQYTDEKGKIWCVSYNNKNNRYHLWTKTKTGKPQQVTTSIDIEKLLGRIPDKK